MPEIDETLFLERMEYYAEESKKFTDRGEAKVWVATELAREFPDLSESDAKDVAEEILRIGYDKKGKDYTNIREYGKKSKIDKVKSGRAKTDLAAARAVLDEVEPGWRDLRDESGNLAPGAIKKLDKIIKKFENLGKTRRDDPVFMALVRTGLRKLREEQGMDANELDAYEGLRIIRRIFTKKAVSPSGWVTHTGARTIRNVREEDAIRGVRQRGSGSNSNATLNTNINTNPSTGTIAAIGTTISPSPSPSPTPAPTRKIMIIVDSQPMQEVHVKVERNVGRPASSEITTKEVRKKLKIEDASSDWLIIRNAMKAIGEYEEDIVARIRGISLAPPALPKPLPDRAGALELARGYLRSEGVPNEPLAQLMP